MITFQLAPGLLPPGRRIYAIGDVHGCADRLGEMHALIRDDLAARRCGDAIVVHLGDLIDRGPDSAGAVRRVADPWPGPDAPRIVNLIGNHEEMMLAALDDADPDAREHWLSNGGAAALRSWGLSPEGPAATWREGMPDAALTLLRGLDLMFESGEYLFVHAGIRPGVAIDRQTREDLLWIREPFLSWRGALAKVIVHGHTPSREPQMRACRIGIDTGAVLGGALTCVVLEGNLAGFFQT